MKPSRFRHRRAGPPAAPKPPRRTLSTPEGTGPLSLAAADPPRAPATAAWTGDETQWLARARAAWQVGDWALLAALGDRSLQRHGERGRLSLLAAAGHFQLGDTAATQRLISQALAWGCDKRLVGRVLVSGLHNTLGRAASLLDQPARALTHFTASILTAAPAGALRRVTQARAGEQLAQLGLSVAAPESLEAAAPVTRVGSASRLAAEARHAAGRLAPDPGPGAAVSRGEWQYFAFPVGAGRLRFVQRHLASARVVTREFGWSIGAGEPLFGIDRGGRLHVVHRSTEGAACRRVSLQPHAIDRWAAPTPLPPGALPTRMVSPSVAPVPLLLLRPSAPAATWQLLACTADGSDVMTLPATLASADLELDLVAEADALHLLARPQGSGSVVEHAVSSDGGRRWRPRPALRPPTGDGHGGVEWLPCGGDAPALLRAHHQRWWAAAAPAVLAPLGLELDASARVLAVDRVTAAPGARLSLLSAEPSAGSSGAWKVSILDFALQ